MALTEKMKDVAREAYLGTLSGGEFLDVFAAVEAALKEQAEQLKKAEDGWARALDKLNDCQTKRGDLIDENHRLRKQARAAEQGQACANCGHHNPHTSPAGDVADACNEADCNCGYYTPTQPPAEDVVERMYEAFDNEGGTYNYRQAMAAALAVAQQERDAQWEKAIRHDMPSEFTDLGIDTFVATLRNRLAKPAEQTDKQKVEAILVNHDFNCTCPNKAIAAEIVAALKAGKR